jgi:hypothetical protein
VTSAEFTFVNCLMDNMLATAVWPRLFHLELGDGERPGPGKVSGPQGLVFNPADPNVHIAGAQAVLWNGTTRTR